MDIFENMCRTCGNDCLDAMNIFVDSVEVLEKKLSIAEILSACLPASSASLTAPAKNDDYPKLICRVCIKKLIMIYEFNNKWVMVNSEFNVALKYEQRRNRSRLAQPPQSSTKPSLAVIEPNDAESGQIKADIVFKNEPSDDVPELEDGMMDETEVNHNLESKKINSTTIAPSRRLYQCGFCEERYQTLAAYYKHHKVTHRGDQYLYYTAQ